MGEGRGSTLVHILVVALSLVAFGFAIAAERRRSTGSIVKDPKTNDSYCVYNSDVATGYGVGAFLFLLASESLLMGITKCMCFGRPLAPGSNRAWSIIYFACSWMTFLVAEACVIAGATKNAYHTKYRGAIYAQNLTCETLRKVTGVLMFWCQACHYRILLLLMTQAEYMLHILFSREKLLSHGGTFQMLILSLRDLLHLRQLLVILLRGDCLIVNGSGLNLSTSPSNQVNGDGMDFPRK
ncbi:hypothetical protein C5167_025471 [Papaver somniferum]|uniref:Uncharacterized protein n=1 Tax=Papaver somniferum TaxID=3469 RepID=A0A4Y7JUJ7_PAPSO|nr:hypothetical protein C5167_025471 [Papaver somniferum]